MRSLRKAPEAVPTIEQDGLFEATSTTETNDVVEIESTDLDEAQAREITEKLRATLVAADQLMITAYHGRVWLALGYQSWDAYADGEFTAARLRLPREERSELVQSLREAGLSLRAIASGTGYSKQTIIDDLRRAAAAARERHAQVVQIGPPASTVMVDTTTGEILDTDEPPTQEQCEAIDSASTSTITGRDGKVYAATRPARAPRRPKAYFDPNNFFMVVGRVGFAKDSFLKQMNELDYSRLDRADAVAYLRDIEASATLMRAAAKRLKQELAAASEDVAG